MGLNELLRQSEGKTLEFKRELGPSESFLKTVVAFANAAGGTVLFGVEDKTRRVVGIEDALELETRLANLLSDAIRPRLAPEVEILPWRKSQVVAVRVYPSGSRPHYLKALGPDAGTFVRVGSTNRRADSSMLDELRRFARNESHDEQPLVLLDSEVIDFRAASELFAPIRRISTRDLRVLGLTVEHQGRQRPTVGGVLLFGRDRHRWFPDAYIQMGRFAGSDRTRITDTAESHSHLPQAIEDVMSFVRKHEMKAIEINGARHDERWSVPLAAVREAVVNAVVHADYAQRGAPIRVSVFDDRIEVENPGLLPFGLTIGDIMQGVSRLRNRVIGRVFKELRLIEQWGSGIARIVSACREANLPEPRLEEIGWHFRVTLPKASSRSDALDPVSRSILESLHDSDGRTTAEIARTIQRTPRATRARLATLVASGRIVEVGSGPQDPKRKYYLKA